MGLNHAIAPRRLKRFRAFLPERLRGRLKGRVSGKRLKDRIKRLAVSSPPLMRCATKQAT